MATIKFSTAVPHEYETEASYAIVEMSPNHPSCPGVVFIRLDNGNEDHGGTHAYLTAEEAHELIQAITDALRDGGN